MSTGQQQPPALKSDDTIAVMAPCSRVPDLDSLQDSVKALEGRGFKVEIHSQTGATHQSSAGTDDEKIAALHELIKRPDVKAIIAARGGNHAGSLLPKIDYSLIKQNPKIIIGYSDMTVLLNSIYKETGLITFHGPMMNNIAALKAEQLDQCFNLLAGAATDIPLPGAQIFKPGIAQGTLVGGNLSLLTSLLGTKWQPDFTNAIILLEDCDDELSRTDRRLLHLLNANAFNKAAGIIVGDFSNMTDNGTIPFGFSLEESIARVTDGLNIPVITNAPFGHGKDFYTCPIGATATLEAGSKKIKLTLAKPAVTP